MVFRSPFPDITVPDVPVHEYVLTKAARYGDRLALVDGTGSGTPMTYAQLDQAVRRLAAGFAAIGVRKGDVIAIFSPNTVAYPVVFYAATMAGATVTTVNALYTAAELAHQLRDSGARYLVTISPFLDRAREATAEAPVDEILVCDPAGGGAGGHRSIQELMAIDAPVPRVEFDPAEDVAVMPYSSGTTALPKGVLLTHRNIVANLVQADSVLRMEDERLVAVLPFFHIYGMAVLMHHALSEGSTVVVLPRFELEQFLRVLAEHRITRAYVAPPIVLALAKHPAVDSYDLSSLRLVLSAAAPLDPDLAEACARRVGCKVAQGYGMTELSPVCMVVPDHDDNPPPGTVGKLIAGTECRLVDPATGADVGVGETGELWVRGPQVMKGYLNLPDETANMIVEDGWLRTGDIARVDADGYWYIVDRVKELIKYKGYQVPPAELEAVLLAHEKIADAAVIGVLDEEGNEVPKAFVVPAAGAALTEEEVIAYVAERVAPHKKVRRVEFIDAIPKAASGKILRKELRAREARVRS